LEEAEVDVTLCGSDQKSLGPWAVYPNAVFQHDVQADMWANRDEISFVPHKPEELHGLRLTTDEVDAYLPLTGVVTCALGMTLTLQKHGVRFPGSLAAGLELQLTANALKTSQEFEKLRRKLQGAVKKGNLWLGS
jgi:hypothetical protein